MAQQNTLLITGAAGFVGSHLLRALVEGQARQAGIDRIVATDIRDIDADLAADERVVARRLDICDRAAVVELFETFAPQTVVHLAAMVTPPPGDHRELQFNVDVRGTRHVIAGCLAAGTEQFIYTSSGAAYGYHPDNPVPLCEDDPVRGNEVFAYAHHKRIVEEELAFTRAKHPELAQLIFRVSTVLGPSTDNQITGLFEQGVVTGIRGTDSPFCVISDEDIVGALLHGVNTGKAGIYNLTGDGVLTLEEIAERMGGLYVGLPEVAVRAALSGLSATGLSPYGPEQVLFLKHRPVLDNTRLKEDFGYVPELTTSQAFERYRRARRHDDDSGPGDPKVVMVTGAGGGLGYALAHAHAERGDRLVLVDRDAEALERTYMMVRAQGGEAICVECDVREGAQCRQAVEASVDVFGGLDTLYNNAAIPLRGLFKDTDADQVARVIDVNLLGSVRMTEAALPSIRARSGRIVTISSVAGFAPLTGRTAYAASKHALHGFFESLRTEVDADGVSITLACPAYIKTAFRDDASDGAAELDVDVAARAIVEAAEARRRLALIGRTAQLAWWANRFAPTVFEKLMRRSVRDEFPS
jgi:UDP-glucose 4-epimerase